MILTLLALVISAMATGMSILTGQMFFAMLNVSLTIWHSRTIYLKLKELQ